MGHEVGRDVRQFVKLANSAGASELGPEIGGKVKLEISRANDRVFWLTALHSDTVIQTDEGGRRAVQGQFQSSSRVRSSHHHATSALKRVQDINIVRVIPTNHINRLRDEISALQSMRVNQEGCSEVISLSIA